VKDQHISKTTSTGRKRGRRSANARDVKGSTIVTGDHNTIQYSVPISTEPTDLAIAREIGDRRGEGAVLGNLGSAYKELGETSRAIQLYEERLTIAREIGDRRGEGNALWNMSLALDQLGERAQAILHAEQALTIYEQIEDPRAAQVRAKLAAWREQPNP